MRKSESVLQLARVGSLTGLLALTLGVACGSDGDSGNSGGTSSTTGGTASGANGGSSSTAGGTTSTNNGGTTASGQGGSSNGGSSSTAGGTTSTNNGGTTSTTNGGTATTAGGKGGTSTTSGGTATTAGGTTTSSGGTTTTTGGTTGAGTGMAATIAAKLGKKNFLIGLGNDEDRAYTLGVPVDLHYVYLSGILGEDGWPDWNTNGTYVDKNVTAARDHGMIPMFTFYQMGAWGDGNLDALTDDGFMGPYWQGAKLMFQRLAAVDGTAIVQLEPDFWGYALLESAGDPTKVPAHVTTQAPDCASLTNDVAGVGKCLVLLARKYAPKVIVGFHASEWSDEDPKVIGQFLVKLGASDADFVVGETLDRDAGCFEAHTDSECQRNDGPWYWDETNVAHPNFHDHLAWVKSLTDTIKKPMLWWQMPIGVPSTTPGGTTGHYRDNRVSYLFKHVDEFVAAGGLGAAFGPGAKTSQTTLATDGGQFKAAVTKYNAAPTALP
ncbi:MAG: hypothetical protein QM756_37590 [Polyangiaceae bacterium]